MVCLCLCCAGEGFCSHILSIIVSLTFSFHAFGIVTPAWMCKGDGCVLKGLYYWCGDGTCNVQVEDSAMLALALIVLISSLTLMLFFCCILHCTSYQRKTLGATLSLMVGGWFMIQELLTAGLLVSLAVQYDRIGWAAYVFTLPGIMCLGLITFILVYMWCSPKKAVHPA